MKILLVVMLLSGCASTVRGINVEGESCEKLKVIYDTDKKKVTGPGG